MLRGIDTCNCIADVTSRAHEIRRSNISIDISSLHLNIMSKPLWIGLDLGATNAKAAIVNDEGAVVSVCELPLPADMSPEPVVGKLIECCQRAFESTSFGFLDISAIGIGCPGKIDIVNGIVEGIANFPWDEPVPLAALISERAEGKPVYLCNDADAVVAAENWVGIGGKSNNFSVVTVGSGIGLGVVNDGQLVQGCSGTIEGGHMIVQAIGGRPCGCGSRGCLEAYTSANSVVKLAVEALESRAEEPSSLRDIAGSRDLSCRDVFDAAKNGDKLAASVVDSVARVLAVGCINISRVCNLNQLSRCATYRCTYLFFLLRRLLTVKL